MNKDLFTINVAILCAEMTNIGAEFETELACNHLSMVFRRETGGNLSFCVVTRKDNDTFMGTIMGIEDYQRLVKNHMAQFPNGYPVGMYAYTREYGYSKFDNADPLMVRAMFELACG